MKLSKAAAAIGAVALGVTALAGCSQDAAETGPVELTVLAGFTGSDRPAYEGLVETFNESHPDIHVTLDIQPWDAIAQSLPSAWASGQGPDIATPSYDPNVMFQYVKTGSALNLDDSGIDVDAFPAAVAEAFTSDGSTYAVPANMADMALFYNKDLLEAAGVEVPSTSDEFVDAVSALTGEGVYGIALPDNGFTLAWTILQWANGGDITDEAGCSVLDSPENLEVFTQWSELVATDGVSPAGLDAPAAESLFSTGKAAFVVGGPWLVPAFTDAGVNFGIAEMPEGAAGPQTAISTVPFMVSAKSAHPDEAAEFLDWWTGVDAQAQFVKDAGFPPVRTDMEPSGNEQLAPFENGLSYGRLVLPGLATASQVTSDAYVPLLGHIMRGDDVAASVDAASSQVNTITGCAG